MIDTTPEGPTPDLELPADDVAALLEDRWQTGYDHAAGRAISYFEHTGRRHLAAELRTVMEEITAGAPSDDDLLAAHDTTAEAADQ